MGFRRYNELGEQVRNRVAIDFTDEPLLTEQAHAAEVNINNIVKRHGIDLIQKTSVLMSADYQFDDLPGNDFQEAMLILKKGQDTFDSLPSELRKKFDNNPAMFMDFVQNPDNLPEMRELGLAQRLPETPAPVEVVVTNPETPVVTNPETPPE